MTNKIGGYQNHPVHTGTGKSVTRERDASAGSSATDAAAAAKDANPVRITDQARQLAALERAVQDAPVVNETRVAAIRLAIEEGRYEISPERIANGLLRMEQELRTAEK